MKLINYSDKAVAVIGDTFKIKNDLKELGGRFNKYLTIDGEKKAGWIFSIKKLPELNNLLRKVAKILPEKVVEVSEQLTDLKTYEILGLPEITIFGLADVYYVEYMKRNDVECMEDAIAVELTGVHVSIDSFERFGDKNRITQSIAKRYLRANGHGIDSIVELVRAHGYDCNEDDIVNYIVDFPNGRPLKNERMRLACDLFREKYGRDLNWKVAKEVVDLYYKMKGELKAINAPLPTDFELDGVFQVNDNDSPF